MRGSDVLISTLLHLSLLALLLTGLGNTPPEDACYVVGMVELRQAAALPAQGAPMSQNIDTIPEEEAVLPAEPEPSVPLPEPVVEEAAPEPEPEPEAAPVPIPEVHKDPAPTAPPRPEPRRVEKKRTPPKQRARAKKAASKQTPASQNSTTSPQIAAARSDIGQKAAAGAGRRGNGLSNGQPYRVDAVDIPPRVTRSVIPTYPRRAQRMRIEGTVLVSMVVDPAGKPTNLAVRKAEPAGVFESAALEAARRYVFLPGTVGGRNVSTLVMLPFHFVLEE